MKANFIELQKEAIGLKEKDFILEEREVEVRQTKPKYRSQIR